MVLPVGFGVFLLFQQRALYSWAVSGLARGAFAVCLITEYPPVREVLWRGALDLVRWRVFRVTVDPLWDRLFEVLYGKAQAAADALLQRLEG